MNAALIKEEAGKIRNEYVRSVLVGAVKRENPIAHLTEQTVWNLAKYIVELEEKAGGTE
ncbi:MAG: hypothetical protein SVR04_00205 [Spirochaetota bacterium]|nr:hypothetical protein [Spirochaetota bacterium]